jgi:large subunit ribosomal protein L13
MKTFSAKNETVERDWYVVDATNKTLGRLASDIAHRLRGKHKPEYTPHVDTGDYIIVINAKDVRVTGNKMKDKFYHHHTLYPGGLKSISLEKQLEKAPERVLESAVKGMLPKNPLGRAMFRKLKIYSGAEHPHTAQQPKELDFDAVSASIAHIAGSGKKAAPVAVKAEAKKAPAKKAAAAKIELPSGKKIKQDDLKVVEGIGPKIEGLLQEAGISNWADLAAADVEKLNGVLAEAGSRYSMHDATTWPKQAQLCVDEAWAELEKYQDELDGGRAK